MNGSESFSNNDFSLFFLDLGELTTKGNDSIMINILLILGTGLYISIWVVIFLPDIFDLYYIDVELSELKSKYYFSDSISIFYLS